MCFYCWWRCCCCFCVAGVVAAGGRERIKTGPRSAAQLPQPSAASQPTSQPTNQPTYQPQAELRAKREAEGEDAEYPDEIDVPAGVEARVRFQKYRCVRIRCMRGCGCVVLRMCLCGISGGVWMCLLEWRHARASRSTGTSLVDHAFVRAVCVWAFEVYVFV